MSIREPNLASPIVNATPGSLVTPLVPTLSLAAATEKQKRNRCTAENCNRRLTLTDFDCRCGARFCWEHRVPESHSCTFDFKAAARQTLTTQLTRVVGDKLERF